jgi:putative two-component system response regulator
MPRIMVIDDTLVVAKAIRGILEQRDHVTGAETDPEKALESILAWKPDLVVVDMDMPRVSGTDLCRLIRANPATASLPILLTCEANRPEDIQAGFDAGANGCIVKPTDLPLIYSHIDTLLAQK